MDIIKFTDPAPMRLRYGEIVNGIRSKMWIERYREAGEFELIAPVSSGIREKLPLGSVISHIDTTEAMIVEDHAISEDGTNEPDVIITGRSALTILDQRIVGSNYFNDSNYHRRVGWDYVMPENYSWEQAKTMINHHILPANLVDGVNDEIPNLVVEVQVGSEHEWQSVTYEARGVRPGGLHLRLVELLELDDLGVRLIRPNISSPLGPETLMTLVSIQNGYDRRNEIVFSYDAGEIENADYLWSNKRLKNSAFIRTKWLETRVTTPGKTGINRRTMWVDATDVDNHIDEMPEQPIYGDIINMARVRGLQALAAQKEVALTKAQISRIAGGPEHKYRTHYNIGDIVTVNGNYNTSTSMRVIEYVEIEDETGESAYPTLSGTF